MGGPATRPRGDVRPLQGRRGQAGLRVGPRTALGSHFGGRLGAGTARARPELEASQGRAAEARGAMLLGMFRASDLWFMAISRRLAAFQGLKLT